MTAEELFREAHAAASRERADLERALWAVVNLPDLITKAKAEDAPDEKWIGQAQEALAHARNIADARCGWIDGPMTEYVEQLRRAASE